MRKSQVLLVLALCHFASASDSSSPDLTGHLKPFGAQGPISEVEHIDGFLSPKEFLNSYVAENRPVLFKGAAKVFPAFKKWTDEYLMAKTPPRPAGDVHVELNKKENRGDDEGFVHFKDFLRDYNTSNVYMVSIVPEFLLRDLILPYPLQCRWFTSGGLQTSIMWFSSGGTSSVIHYDVYENFNCVLRGRKNLVLLNATRYSAQVKEMIDNDEKAHSTADVDKIDVEKRPEFSGLEFNSVEMEPGDCIYIPVNWVHQVRSFDSNLAVNAWWFPQDKYDTAKCFHEFKTSLRFDLVFFALHVGSVKDDFDIIRLILTTNLKPPITVDELLAFLSAGDVKAMSTVMPQLPFKVMSLFKALDSNKDSLLSMDELVDQEYKTILSFRKMILEYNTAVFAMHQAAEHGTDVGKLPKLIPIDGSDRSFYAPEITWPMPSQPEETESGADEESPDDKPDSAKDEL